ncbi:sensor histidine kinase [Micromonospora auratinigra]|uniref:histidine kinase n=1 Tax=Micromonospora auratinigra TaxID=261654 RepID=A0A1A8Z7L5_9ACTN|nr:sensor histidine kinase [Micromonospora auratinigra]SBT39822.1 Histidine kinase-, DNA gyrase B-, and HSP90-like ATPase [Micromonospora auratinigra]
MENRDRWGTTLDVALGLGCAAAVAVQSVALASSWGGTYWVFGAAVGGSVTVLALLRRRHRGGTAVAGLVLAALAVGVAALAGLPHEPGPATALPLAVLVASAVGALPPRPAAAIAAGALGVVLAGAAAAIGGAGSWPRSGAAALTWWNAAAWLGAVGIGGGRRWTAGRRRAAAERVRRDERLELARELHDVVAHHITGIVVQAQAAQLVGGRRPERARQSLAGIESAGSEALAAMRRLVGILRDDADGAPASPGPEQLAELVARFERHGVVVGLRVPDQDPGWPPEVTGTVYRVVREALTNVARHAPDARRVTVEVGERDGTVTVEVTDDGPAPPTRRPRRAGYGLLGMRERVEALGGTLAAGPRPAGGWSVEAAVPVPAGERR